MNWQEIKDAAGLKGDEPVTIDQLAEFLDQQSKNHWKLMESQQEMIENLNQRQTELENTLAKLFQALRGEDPQ